MLDMSYLSISKFGDISYSSCIMEDSCTEKLALLLFN